MKTLLIAVACALAALSSGALAQQRGPGGPHGGGSVRDGGFRGRGGYHRPGGVGAPGGLRGGVGVSRGFNPGAGHTHFLAGPVGRFGPRDIGAWRGGHWWHGFRGGRLGWWWFADGFWYWYDEPVYPFPDVVSDYSAPSEGYTPPSEVWYFCRGPRGYYPYVPACPSGWRVVPASPGPDDPE